MKGTRFKYNRAIIYPAIVNLAYHCGSVSGQGVTVQDVFDFCPEGTVTKKTLWHCFDLFVAKGILQFIAERDSEGGKSKKQNMYILTALGKMQLNKCNSELAILFDSIGSNHL
jgi:hypothetical protein